MILKGRKILLGITGSIAAYKSVFLVRLLIREGAEVKVIMTDAAKDFIAPLTLSTLSKNPVLSELFDDQSWSNHVMLGRWADIMIIAPLSVNTLAKMANGQCDNLLLATWLSATCPVVLAPAMDEDMWHHPATKNNLDKLSSYNNQLIPVEKGELASGLFGDGRMAEPGVILDYLTRALGDQPLKGKKALVTAGPTYEAIDPVRFIGNHSSGKMGVAIAEELRRKGAEVTLVMGPGTVEPAIGGIIVRKVISALEMFNACDEVFDKVDLAVMAAAVADYTPVKAATQKIKKLEQEFSLELTRTRDILGTLGGRKKPGQVLVGFALETFNEKESAMGKLEKKNADLIVLNSLNDEGAGFGIDTNKVTIFRRGAEELQWPVKPKREVARDLVDLLINNYYA
ncbi:MAG: bifunctional phosphopantothenoylcysteine decarboxylase/phosphopantothenate--cysteine ligase CoaBC [Chitinophagaceae bacterium]